MSGSSGPDEPVSTPRRRTAVPTVQKVITQFEKPLLQEIDFAARERGLKRSAFLRVAARNEIQRMKQDKIIEAARRGTKHNTNDRLQDLEAFRSFL